MKKIFRITSLLLMGACAQAQEVIHEKKIYKRVDSITLVADMFYTPQTFAVNDNPAIAFFHGGGWSSGSPSEFHEACRRYAKKGFITFSFQYRLSADENGRAPHPDITPVESVKDARSAIRWLRKNAGSLKINPEQIVVGGQSAGGQLTLSTTMQDDLNEASDDLTISTVPNAMLLYASCVNTIEPWCEYLMPGKREELWTISPYHNLKKNLPPAIAFHGREDQMADYWTVVVYARESKKLGNHFDLITYDGREHYLGGEDETYSGYFDEEIMERTDEFLVKFGFMDSD